MKEDAAKGEVRPKDGTKVMEEQFMFLERRVKSLEEGFFTFSKFGLKVTHAVATTLQLLA